MPKLYKQSAFLYGSKKECKMAFKAITAFCHVEGLDVSIESQQQSLLAARIDFVIAGELPKIDKAKEFVRLLELSLV